MIVWIVFPGEELPIDGNARPWRYSLIADQLLARGHEVVRWAPTFSHARKRLRSETDQSIAAGPALSYELLHAGTYQRHVSFARLRYGTRLAKRFTSVAPERPRPDVIICGIPSPELAAAVANFAGPRSIPFVIDVRDLWPDIYADAVPRALRGLAVLALRGARAQVRYACRHATMLSALSESYLAWALEYAGRERRALDVVVPMANDTSVPSDAARARVRELLSGAGVEPTTAIALFAGSLNRQFDVDAVLLAARRFHESGDRRVHFVICGDGDRRERWESAAASLPNVTFTGWIDRDALAAWLRESTFGLAPYRDATEHDRARRWGALPIDRVGGKATLSNKTVEYLSAGLALVTSAGGEVRALVKREECGVFVTDDREDPWGTAIRDLLDAPDALARMRCNAKAVYERAFQVGTVYGGFAERVISLTSTNAAPRGI